jgi:hypothetical protein
MRKIEVSLGDLMCAFEDASWEMSRYLDLETGRVVMITDETRRELESIYEEVYDPDAEQPLDLAGILQQRDLPEWQQQELLEADQIDKLYGSRYIGVPQADSHEGYRDMEDFITTVEDERLQDQLWQAIGGRGAFRRFKDVLAHHFRERERILRPWSRWGASCRATPRVSTGEAMSFWRTPRETTWGAPVPGNDVVPVFVRVVTPCTAAGGITYTMT